MEFDYEITADDYADASVIYFRLSSKRYRSVAWFIAGAFVLIVSVTDEGRGWSPPLLGAIGVWWMLGGVGGVSPRLFRWHYRGYYKRLDLAGQKYHATLNEEGFQVAGENRSWTNRWVDVSTKGEDKRVFMLYASGTLFIFAKRYLADEQQQSLRSLAGLARG